MGVAAAESGGGKSLKIVLGILAVGALAVIVYLLLKGSEENADITFTVAVQDNSSFEVFSDGDTLGTVAGSTTKDFSVRPSAGTHTVLLRAKDSKDTKVTIKLHINNASKYHFISATATNGSWDALGFGEDEINGHFGFDLSASSNRDFSFTYNIAKK